MTDMNYSFDKYQHYIIKANKPYGGKCMNKKILLIISFFYMIYCYAELNHYYFYQPEIDLGSEGSFTPMSMWINGGYDILRNGAHDQQLTNQEYRNGFKYVCKSLAHPIDSIELIGWDNFLAQEFPNFKLRSEKLNFMPNIPIHTIGEGMRYVKVSEWYDYHGYPFPKTLGLLTSISYQFMNETLEQGNCKTMRTDPLADIYVYNNLGFILFSIKPVKRFFSETFVVNDWSLQPVYNPFNDHIDNAGEQYMGKVKVKGDYSLFCYWGMDFLLGMSVKKDNDRSISIGLGQSANKIGSKVVNGIYVPVVSSVDPAIGVFYDYKNSLIANAHFSFDKDSIHLKTNVYPGLVSIKGVKPGLFAEYTSSRNHVKKAIIGFSIQKVPIGLFAGKSK